MANKYYNKEKHRVACNKYRTTHREYYNTYHRELHAQRRAEFMVNRNCSHCGTTKHLVLHHIFPKDPALEKPNGNNSIWGWEEPRRIKELLKCIVLCDRCHRELHAQLRKENNE